MIFRANRLLNRAAYVLFDYNHEHPQIAIAKAVLNVTEQHVVEIGVGGQSIQNFSESLGLDKPAIPASKHDTQSLTIGASVAAITLACSWVITLTILGIIVFRHRYRDIPDVIPAAPVPPTNNSLQNTHPSFVEPFIPPNPVPEIGGQHSVRELEISSGEPRPQMAIASFGRSAA
ncbi:hypothetical protein TWF281_010462 [Arthrobotrys megalospora]